MGRGPIRKNQILIVWICGERGTTLRAGTMAGLRGESEQPAEAQYPRAAARPGRRRHQHSQGPEESLGVWRQRRPQAGPRPCHAIEQFDALGVRSRQGGDFDQHFLAMQDRCCSNPRVLQVFPQRRPSVHLAERTRRSWRCRSGTFALASIQGFFVPPTAVGGQGPPARSNGSPGPRRRRAEPVHRTASSRAHFA
jgi:hypothetical protein